MTLTLRAEDWFPDDGSPIVVARREPQLQFDLHSHEFSELVIVTGGQGLHVTDSESWPLTAGDAFVISDQTPHAYENLDELMLINILYLPDDLQMPLLDLGALSGYHALFSLEPRWRSRHQFRSRLHLDARQLHQVTELIDRLEAELIDPRPGHRFMALSWFMQLVGYLSRCYNQSSHPDSKSLLRIADAIVFLEQQYDTEITLEQMADIAGMATRSFLRDFQKAMGTSPVAYLLQLRINRAAELLRRDEHSISEVAFRVGFSDSNYFSRQFRKFTGMTPRDYRKNHRE